MSHDTPAPTPAMLPAVALGDHWHALPAWAPIPGLGLLANNAFVHAGREPLLVDTGIGLSGDAFLDALGSVVDPADLRWIWLSHADPDHTGNLARLLELAPRARVLAGFLGIAKLQLQGMDVSRFDLVSPGDTLELGGRGLRAIRPPCYDAPETLGFQAADGALYVVDSFGAVLPGVAGRLEDIDDWTLEDGLVSWGALDAPWQAELDPLLRERRFGAVARTEAPRVLTAHLPVGQGAGARLARAANAAARRLPSDMRSLLALRPAGKAAAAA